MSDQRWPVIPEPGTDPNMLFMSVMSLKESMELLTGQRGYDASYSFDNQIAVLTKSANNISATVAENKQVAANANGAVAQRTTLVEAEIYAARAGEPNLNARVVSVDTASVSRDGALASSLSAVTARVNDVSAGGFFKMTASVSGVSLASMEAQVYTTTSFSATASAGFRVDVAGGVGYFTIYTSQFRLTDNSGNPYSVLYYSSGKFYFTGNVAIDGDLTINGTLNTSKYADLSVSTPKIANNAVSSAALAVGASYYLDATIYARAGAVILITGQLEGKEFGSPGGTAIYTGYLLVNGSILRSINTIRVTSFEYTGGGEGSTETRSFVIGATPVYTYTVPASGYYTFTLQDFDPVISTLKFLWVTELVK